jgi:hypothetical protein
MSRATEQLEGSNGRMAERWLYVATAAAAFALALAIRVRGIGRHFWMLGDQIRDWSIALGPLHTLPLVGPPTHVRGYTIGPAYYWILWGIRVVFGPWFRNLPHGGGIGHAVVQSVADAFLLVAVWRRTRSPWLALATVTLLVTAPYDLCLSALVWTPTMGTALTKLALAVVLLEWPRRSIAAVVLSAVLAWASVQVYTGSVFAALGVLAALLIVPYAEGRVGEARRNLLILATVVALLQLPYLVHRLVNQSGPAMGAVTGSVLRVLSGGAAPELGKSQTGYAAAFNFIEVAPWRIPFVGWLLTACGLILALRHRTNALLLSVLLIPQVAAIVGYALFLGALDHYYYLSLMPVALLTVLLSLAPPSSWRFANAVGVAVLVVVLALIPGRLRLAATMHKMPEYGVLVDGSARIVNLRQPMRAIRTEFKLPPTSDPEFLYRILGGRLDRAAPWVGVVTGDGQVLFQRVDRGQGSPRP